MCNIAMLTKSNPYATLNHQLLLIPSHEGCEHLAHLFLGRDDEVKVHTIVVTQDGDESEYQAHIEGEPGIWGFGETIEQAIGSLILRHASACNFKVVTPTSEVADSSPR